MNGKVFVVCIVALFGIQGFAHGFKQVPKSLESEALAALDELKHALEPAVEEAVVALRALEADIKTFGNAKIDEGKALLEEEANKYLAEIENIIANAVEDVTACVEGEIEAIKQLPLFFGEELVKCITDQVEEAVNIINEAIALVEGTLDKIDEFKAAIEACDGGILCLPGVIKDIALAVIELPAQVINIVTETEDFVTSIKQDIELCAITKVALLAVEAGKIVAKIVECIAQN